MNFCNDITKNKNKNWIVAIELLKLEDFKKKKKKTVARVIIQSQTILLYFYKLLLWPISYWFSSWLSNNITFFIYQ